VILNMPNSMAKAGLALGSFFQLWAAVVSLYTLWLLSNLYQEYKRRAVSLAPAAALALRDPVLPALGSSACLNSVCHCHPGPLPSYNCRASTRTPFHSPLTHSPTLLPLTHSHPSATQIKEDEWYNDETGTRRIKVTQCVNGTPPP
jgi:hypothetical protein